MATRLLDESFYNAAVYLTWGVSCILNLKSLEYSILIHGGFEYCSVME